MSSTTQVQDHARLFWVRIPPYEDGDLQEWWPAFIYQTAVEAMANIKANTAILSYIFQNSWNSNSLDRKVAYLLGNVDDKTNKIMYIDDEGSVRPFYQNVGVCYNPSTASPLLNAAMSEAARVGTGTQESTLGAVSDTSQSTKSKGRKQKRSSVDRSQQTTTPSPVQHTDAPPPAPAQIVTGNNKRRGRPPKGSECSSFSTEFSPMVNSTPVKNQVQNLAEASPPPMTINGFSDTTQFLEDDKTIGTEPSTFSAGPSEKSSITESDPWKNNWDRLKRQGWSYRAGSGLIDFYYLPPNGTVKGIENVDYFTSTQSVMNFVSRNKAGVQPSDIKEKAPETKKRIIAEKKKVFVDDEATVYSYYAAESTVCSDEYAPGEIRPNDSWKEVWDKLRYGKGWTYKTGGGMISWYYIPPGGSAPSKENQAIENKDYFTDEKKLKEFIMENYNWKGECTVGPVPIGFHLHRNFDVSWNQLEKHGWKYDKVKKTYHIPITSSSGRGSRRREGGEEGKDYFRSKNAVEEFLKPLLKKIPSTNQVKSGKKVSVKKKGKPGAKKRIHKSDTKGTQVSNKTNKSKSGTGLSTELVNDNDMGNALTTREESDESSSSSDIVTDERIVRPGKLLEHKEAWKILERVFKFKYKNKQYVMPDSNSSETVLTGRDCFDTVRHLRKHLCSHGIPVPDKVDIDDLFYSKRYSMPVIGDDKIDLVRYLAMTNVPLLDPKYIPDVQLLSDEEALTILRRNCLKQDKSTFILSTTEKDHVFEKVGELKAYICRFGFTHYTWNDEEHLNISLWAANSPDTNFFDGRKEPKEIGLNASSVSSSVHDTAFVVLNSPGNVSDLPSPEATPKKIKQSTNNDQERTSLSPIKEVSLSPREQAKENMRNIIQKGGQPVHKDDEWVNVLEKMKFTGWKHVFGKGLLTDRYILPNGSATGKEHEDFLASEYDAKCFAATHFGWNADGDAKYIEEKNRRATPGRTRSPKPNVTTQSTPRRRSLYAEKAKSPKESQVTPSNKKRKNIDESESVRKSTPPTGQIICVQSTEDDKSQIAGTAVVTESKRAKPSLYALTSNVQRNLSGAFDEQVTIGRKLLRCQLALQASFEMGMKHRYGTISEDDVLDSAASKDQTAITMNSVLSNVSSLNNFLSDISRYIESGRTYSSPKLLHILGPPGSGKTSSVKMCLQEAHKRNKLKKFDLAIWNASSMKSSMDLFPKISVQLGLNEHAPEAAIENKLKARSSLFIAAIDEVDLILSRNTRGLQEFFKWSYSPQCNFVLILISNSYENQKLSTLLPPGYDVNTKKTLVFRAYDKADLTKLLTLRVGDSLFEDKAIGYIAAKAAADGGDARRALSIASRTITKYSNTLPDKEKSNSFSSFLSNGPPICLKHALMAVKDLDKSGPLDSIEALPAAAKIALAVATAMSCAPNTKNRIITRGRLISNCRLVASHNIINVLSDVGNQWVSDVLDQLHDTGLIDFSGDEDDCYCPADEKIVLRVSHVDVESSLDDAWPQKGYYRRIAHIIHSTK